jgi:hypothetical protein
MAVGWAGRQSNGSGNVQMPPANFKACSRYQNTLGVDLTVTTLYIYWGQATAGAKVKGVVYSDAAGPTPNALLQVTPEQIGVGGVAGEPSSFTFATPWVWPAGVWLWMGVISDTQCDTGANGAGTDTNGVAYNSNSYASGPSDPFGSPSFANFQYRIWAEGYDGAHKLGRIATDEGRSGSPPLGVYSKWDPHADKFTLGNDAAPMDGQSVVSVTGIWIFYTNTNATVHIHAALYANDGGGAFTPHLCTLLGVTAEVVGITAGTWVEYAFAAPIEIAAGTYWLLLVTNENDVHCHVAGFSGVLSSHGAESANDNYTFPATINGGTFDNFLDQHPEGLSLYAAYTPGGSVDPAILNVTMHTPQIVRHVHAVPY